MENSLSRRYWSGALKGFSHFSRHSRLSPESSFSIATFSCDNTSPDTPGCPRRHAPGAVRLRPCPMPMPCPTARTAPPRGSSGHFPSAPQPSLPSHARADAQAFARSLKNVGARARQGLHGIPDALGAVPKNCGSRARRPSLLHDKAVPVVLELGAIMAMPDLFKSRVLVENSADDTWHSHGLTWS